MNSEAPQTLDEIRERWTSCHLYYHQDLDRVLRGFVHPVVASLVKEARIEAFFFVRYALGGPHIRLRLRALPDSRDHVLKEVQRFAQDFLDLIPSTESLEADAIRRTNESILTFDPNEIDNAVYPDNSFRVTSFHPEVQRYGGPGLFQASLDFFTLSSVAAVDFLSKHEGMPRVVQLAHAFRLLLQQALGFAADETELLDLLRYGMDSWGGGPPKIIEKGDKVFQSQVDTFLQLFRDSLAGVRSVHTASGSFGGALDFLVVGASKLSAAIKTADRSVRTRIGGSQLHMTATRLGISNAEEVYLSRLLTLTLSELRAAGEENLSWLGEKIARGSAEDPGEALGNLLSPALAALAEVPMSPRALQP
jgi:lantibiotic biosynthesis dehydratase-like protein